MARSKRSLTEVHLHSVEVRGAHVRSDNPLASCGQTNESQGSRGHQAPAQARRRRWGLLPVVITVGALAVGFGGGAAYAYFTGHGSGTGHATAGSAQGVTVTAVVSPGADSNLYPGGPGVAVHFTVNNPNAYAVSFAGWSTAALSMVTPVGGNTCTTGDFQIAAVSGTFSPALSIPANTPSSRGVGGTATGVVQLKTTAQNGCQGATVTVTLTLAGGKSS